MRDTTGPIWDIWTRGGPFVGVNSRSHGRVTVEKNWRLETSHEAGGYAKTPVRYFQRADGSQVETEVPNIATIQIERSIDQDAATCTITLFNQQMLELGAQPLVDGDGTTILGQPGYFTFNYGDSAESRNKWGHSENEWNDVIVPNALLRTYQGYGGHNKPIMEAVEDGNLLLTGVWLVDEVRIGSDGMMTIACRDMAKLLIEQHLYPPLVPSSEYPLHYCRFYKYSNVQPRVDYGVAAGMKKWITGIQHDVENDGYWLCGSDGSVFAYGNTFFQGSRSGEFLDPDFPKITSIASTASGKGYWILRSDGKVYAFGDAPHLGDLTTLPGDGLDLTVHAAVGIDRFQNGYVMVLNDGRVYVFGCPYHGNPNEDGYITGSLTNGQSQAVAIMATSVGYWVVDDRGMVWTYASGGLMFHHGNLPPALPDICSGAAATPSGGGYYLVLTTGAVYQFGDAVHRGDTGTNIPQNKITDITVKSDNGGYWLVGEDGAVYTYGSVQFYGALPGDYSETFTTPGNYEDYTDIVRDLLLWAGFHLYDNGQNDHVYGNLETTGAYAEECISDDLFDKRPVIDAITQLKEIVGYLFWVDEEGAAHFESPNWWAPGNYLPDGSLTAVIPEVDEKRQLTRYSVSANDRSLRSEIIISTEQPTEALDSTVTTIYRPEDDGLRGIVRPAMWVNGVFTDEAEQRIMAELIALHIFFSQRLGSVEMAANPMLQINDQVRIFERMTGETFVHYIRGISSSHNLQTGEYTMTLTTHWLGDADAWAVDIPRNSTGEITVNRGA